MSDVSSEALAENRGGRLTGDQTRRFQLMVSGRRSGTRGLALPVGAIGVLLLVLNGPARNEVERHLAAFGFIAAAAVLLVAPMFDPLAADVRGGRVETVEGAVGKRRVASGTRTGFTRYYLTVGGRELRTYRSDYEAAPDAGDVRAYYLPRTRRLVNLERLIGAVQDPLVKPSASQNGAAGGGLVRSALVGRWTHPLVTIALAENGMATVTTVTGVSQTGHWSVDSQGRLVTDVTGRMEPTDATLDGDRLTIQLEGRRLTFTR